VRAEHASPSKYQGASVAEIVVGRFRQPDVTA
jgi:hypothetical protein